MKSLMILLILFFSNQLSAQNNFFSDTLNQIEPTRLFSKYYDTHSTVDLNNDGLDDFVCWANDLSTLDYFQNASTADSIQIIRKDVFSSDIDIFPRYPQLTVPNFCFFDMDFDGDLDMISLNKNIYEPASYQLFINSGDKYNPCFTGERADSLLNIFSLPGWNIYSLNSVDLDNDNQKEVLAVYSKGHFSLYDSSKIDLFKWQTEGDTTFWLHKPDFLKLWGPPCRIRSINFIKDSLAELIISSIFDSPMWGDYLLVNDFIKIISASDSCLSYEGIQNDTLQNFNTGIINTVKLPFLIKEDFIHSGKYYRQGDDDLSISEYLDFSFPAGVLTFTTVPSGVYRNDLILVYTTTSYPSSMFLPDVIKSFTPDYYRYFYSDSFYYKTLREKHNLPSLPSKYDNEPVFSLADFDDDGDLDIIEGTGNYDTWNNESSTYTGDYACPKLYYWRNTGSDSVWQWERISKLRSSGLLSVYHPFAIDWDGDNDYDLFVAFDNKLYFVENIGSPQVTAFSADWIQIDGIEAHYPCLFNFYGDSQPDLIVLNKQNKLVGYYNSGPQGTLDFKKIPGGLFDKINDVYMGYKSVRGADLDNDGKTDLLLGKWSKLYFSKNISTVGIKFDEPKLISSFRLFQNFPNPVKNKKTTTINYQILKHGLVEISVYNILGQKVTTLVQKNQSPGKYNIKWNASGLPSGVYFYRLKVGASIQQRKLLLIH